MEVLKLDCEDPAGAPLQLKRLHLSTGATIEAKTIVIASGARYRRPGIPNLADFGGNGVSYWASPVEARLCEGEEVALVGGGNSAGQAVVYLAPKVKRLHLVIRRNGLEETMSKYLIDRIAALPNVEIHRETEIVELAGDGAGRLGGATFRHRSGGATLHRSLRHLFLFVGADPNAEWLSGCVAVDKAGFVQTGPLGGPGGAVASIRLPLETDRPGIFAIGDVRAGSTKRVAAAVGEGAAVVSQIHSFLAP